MKKILVISAIATFFMMYSCDEVLKEDVYGQISNEEFWQTEADAVAGIKSAYAETRGGWQGLSVWQFVVEDLGTDIGTGGYFSTYDYSNYTNWSGTNPDFPGWGIWPAFWQSINYANTILDRVPGMEIDEAVKNRILGEAHGIRAMVYFHLVNWFGGVPEITTTTEIPLELPRQTVESNYTLIEADLKIAIDNLPSKSELINLGEADYGRLSKQAVQSLLARVYLQLGRWSECSELCESVINSGQYSLETDYLNMFSFAKEGYNNSEVIWVLPFIAGSSPTVDGLVLQVYCYRAPEKSDFDNYYDWSGDIRSTTSFYESFESGDLRREGLFRSSDGTTDPIMLLKYPADPATDGRYSGNDYPFIRYADILLMKAEALTQLDDPENAVNEINKVRARAGLAGINAADFDKESLLHHILQERRWEFYFEGHAKRDMVRLDPEGMLEHIKAQSSDWETYGAERYLLLPLPTGALAANPGLEQNPGF
ncbi:MAG: RagB/SusD family nutrient uptake outer membrane protein [Bacteroidales bacterium]|nr:RagB/SusD family nutrient uptake outer membrane protein [Bacteroidales bacterium]